MIKKIIFLLAILLFPALSHSENVWEMRDKFNVTRSSFSPDNIFHVPAIQFPDATIARTAPLSQKPINFIWTSSTNPNYPISYANAGGTDQLSVAADDSGGMWVTDGNDNSVWRYTPQGVATEITGLGNHPVALAYDGGYMWVVNGSDPLTSDGANSISLVGPTSVITTYPGIGNGLSSIAWDGRNMWATELYEPNIFKITPTGNPSITSISVTTCPVSLSGLQSIAFDGTNMFAVGISANNNVVKITSDCVETDYSIPGVGNLSSLAYDGNGSMWIVDEGNSHISKFSTLTGATTTYGNLGDSQPYKVAFDGANMWVTGLNDIMTKVSLNGQITALPGLSVSGWNSGVGGGNTFGIDYDGANSVWISFSGGNGGVVKLRTK